MLLLKTILHNLHQTLVSWDQAITTTICSIVLPHEESYADEPLSARALRWEINGIRSWPRKLIDKLFWWDDNHCAESYESEKLGRQLPPELR